MTEAEGTPSRKPVSQRIDWRRLGHAIALLILIVIVIPFVASSVPQVVTADHSYVVLSGSMGPALSPGDVIFVDAADPSAIQAGDVITFVRGSESTPTTHRVVEVVDQSGKPAFRTKGDANEDPDSGLVQASQVQGRVMTLGGYLFAVPYIGYVIEFMNTQLGFVLLVLLPIGLFVISEVWNFVGAGRRSLSTQPLAEDDGSREITPQEEEASVKTDAGDRPSAETADGTFTLRSTELRLAILILVAFMAYSLWVAVNDVEPWSVGVTAAVAVATILLGGLYYFGGHPPAIPEGEDTAEVDYRTVPVLPGKPPEIDSDGQTLQPVESFETMVELAVLTDHSLFQDPDDQTHYLVLDETLFVYEGPRGGDHPAIERLDDRPAESVETPDT